MEENRLDFPIRLECDSFPQAFRVLCSGQFAAILPKIARCELPKEGFLELDLPFLNTKPRQVCLVWNPRTLRVHGGAEAVVAFLKQTLGSQVTKS